MSDPIFANFVEHTVTGARELAAASDVMTFAYLPLDDESLFLVEFRIPYIVQQPNGVIASAPGPLGIAVRLTPEYLNHVDPLLIAQVRDPDFFHPNHRWPVLCVGGIRPGTPLAQAIRHIYEIVTYQNFATDDGLNPAACQRLRDEPSLIDRLPKPPRLVRRQLDLD